MSAQPKTSAQGEKKAGVVLKCQDGGEVVVSDKAIIEKLTYVANKLAEDVPNWKDEGVYFEKTLELSYPTSAIKFIVEHVNKYVSPDDRSSISNVQKHYPETINIDLEDLKYLIEGANTLECQSFVQCMGFVIADRLKNHEVESIIQYLGVSEDIEPGVHQGPNRD